MVRFLVSWYGNEHFQYLIFLILAEHQAIYRNFYEEPGHPHMPLQSTYRHLQCALCLGVRKQLAGRY